MTPAQSKWIRTIHVAKRELGLSDELYESVLCGIIGSPTSKDIKNWEQYDAVMQAFKALGFSYKHRKPVSSFPAEQHPDYISARQEYYIRGLWKLASRNKDEKSLRAMVKRIGGVDDISFLPRKKAAAVIQALRDIAGKAGFNPDCPGGV